MFYSLIQPSQLRSLRRNTPRLNFALFVSTRWSWCRGKKT